MSGESSPISAYLPQGSFLDFPGHMAAVLFTAGCNFRCGFCHNAAMLGARQTGMPWAELEQRCRQWREDWVTGAVITGGEPTLWPELPELVRFLRRQGLKVKLDTNGSHPEVLRALLPELTYVAMDVKCGLATYPRLTQFAHTERIAASIAVLLARGRDYEFRTTVLPEVHDDAEMRAIGALVHGAARYVLQPFLPRDDLPDERLRTAPRCPPAHLQRCAALVKPHVRELIVRGA